MMLTCYVDRDTRSIADLVHLEEDHTWLITRINVPAASRGLRRGSQLLKKITNDADGCGAILVVHPSPSGGLDFTQLCAWYERNGFKTNPDRTMTRQPTPKEDT